LIKPVQSGSSDYLLFMKMTAGSYENQTKRDPRRQAAVDVAALL